MTRLGIPVPPGFIITTDACKKYLSEGKAPLELEVQVTRSLRRLEDESQKRFGDGQNPLLISVRSGAKNSMPGMMETILNVGLNDKSVIGLGKQTNNPRFAWDAYRRLIQMFGKTVLGIEGSKFTSALAQLLKSEGETQDQLLSVSALQRLVTTYKEIVEIESGSPFPQDPRMQLDLSVYAVFDSWNTERAKLYRRRERIADDLGTAVNIVAMVFGNMGEDSGTGVCFTRDPATGERGAYGDYLTNAQGEDVVSGARTPLMLAQFQSMAPRLFDELAGIMYRLETHYRDICDIEFSRLELQNARQQLPSELPSNLSMNS
jgi:pyruvate,orthophosphate dikinase